MNIFFLCVSAVWLWLDLLLWICCECFYESSKKKKKKERNVSKVSRSTFYNYQNLSDEEWNLWGKNNIRFSKFPPACNCEWKHQDCHLAGGGKLVFNNQEKIKMKGFLVFLTKYTAADIWLHSEYIWNRKWKCACMCVCFVHSYLRTFAARGRENCRTPAAFGITATLPPAGRQQVQPKLALFFSCHFSPLTADIPSFSLPPLYSFLLCS